MSEGHGPPGHVLRGLPTVGLPPPLPGLIVSGSLQSPGSAALHPGLDSVTPAGSFADVDPSPKRERGVSLSGPLAVIPTRLRSGHGGRN